MDNSIYVSIAKDFDKYPGLRTYDISREKSGEYFYHQILNEKFYEALTTNKKLVVNLDGTAGYPPSFIDEAFGRLVYDFGADLVKCHLEIISDEEPIWRDAIFGKTLTNWTERKAESRAPQITEEYSRAPWWHISKAENPIKISSYGEL